MHAYDIMLMVSIICVLAFSGVIYVDDDLALALGYVFAAVAGVPTGALLAMALAPVQLQFALIFGGFAGGIALMLAVRRYFRNSRG